jgi:hypothetical protein
MKAGWRGDIRADALVNVECRAVALSDPGQSRVVQGQLGVGCTIRCAGSRRARRVMAGGESSSARIPGTPRARREQIEGACGPSGFDAQRFQRRSPGSGGSGSTLGVRALFALRCAALRDPQGLSGLSLALGH